MSRPVEILSTIICPLSYLLNGGAAGVSQMLRISGNPRFPDFPSRENKCFPDPFCSTLRFFKQKIAPKRNHFLFGGAAGS